MTTNHAGLIELDARIAGLTYVVVTPARNEAAFIEQTIQSMVAQTVRPLRWAIVSDGSTDETDEIVAKYAAQHDWIELVRRPERRERHFAGKVHAFNAGYERVKHLSYDCLCSLDADISFGPDHFSFLLGKMELDSKLGLVGTPFRERDMSYDYRFVSIKHVSGACQMFRRECFEDIGGYVAVKGGGIDHIAVITARMKGWGTRAFTERYCSHHRKLGTADKGQIKTKFQVGKTDYALGGHPLWEFSRSAYQMTKRPFVVGGLMILAGYLSSALRREARPVTCELVRFRRREQMDRLWTFCRMLGRRQRSSEPPNQPAFD